MSPRPVKAALHVHSKWSYDGHLTLIEIAREFSDRGYNAVFVSEHDIGFSEQRRVEHREACSAASNEKILLIPGIEYSDPANLIHLLVWGNVPFLGTGRPTSEVLARARSAGAACVLAHPSRRSAWQSFQKEWVSDLSAIEIWNRKTDGWAPSLAARKLIVSTGVRAVLGHDFHTSKQRFPMAVQLTVHGKITEENCLNALQSGGYACHVFGIPLQFFKSEPAYQILSKVEGCRRLLARLYRFLSSLKTPFLQTKAS
jgi:hypothetical protein